MLSIHDEIKFVHHLSNDLKLRSYYENALDIKKLEISYLNEVLKQPIILSHSLIQTLHNATQDAQKNLRANNIPVPFIQDGYLWQKMPDGKNIQLEKIEPLKSA